MIITQRPPSTSANLIPDKEDVLLTIINAAIEDNQFADPNPDGTQPRQCCITWELQEADLTSRQRTKLRLRPGKRIWQRLGLFYYIRENGLPTMFKNVIDALVGYPNSEGIAFAFDLATFEANVADLIGIKAPCLVEQYAKVKGANRGQIDNRIIKVRPAAEGDEEGAVPAASAPAVPARAVGARPRGSVPQAHRNVPQPVEDETDLPF